MPRSPIEIQAAQTKGIQMLDKIQTDIGRAVQQTSNSFAAVVSEATALQAFMVANDDAFQAADLAFLAQQIAGLATTVDTVASQLRALIPAE
jgi:uncharacterized coiled-coil protein SlyX